MLFKFQNHILLLTAVRVSEHQRKLGLSGGSATFPTAPSRDNVSGGLGGGVAWEGLWGQGEVGGGDP